MSQITTKEDAIKAILDAIDHQDIDIIAFANSLEVAFCPCIATIRIEVKNLDDLDQEVSVSKTCNDEGDDSYFRIEPGNIEKWNHRCVGHKVEIKVNGGGSLKHTVGPSTGHNRFIIIGGEVKRG